MQKFLLSFVLCLCSFWASAQGSLPVQGSVSDGLQPLEGVHIKNVSTNRFSISNRKGRYSIPLSLGDTVVYSHISMHDLIKIIGEEDLASESLNVVMLERDNELEEVVLEDRDYALELGIISERKEKLSTYERRLHTAGDFKPIHLLGLLAGSLELDPIINAISGRTKRMKRNIKIEKKIENINLIKSRYLDYMLETFDSPKEEIETFLDHLVELPGLEPIVQSKNPEQVKFFLLEEWFKFREKQL